MHNNYYNISIDFDDVQVEIILLEGFFNTMDTQKVMPHHHNYYECHFLNSGYMNMSINNRAVRMAPHNICIIPPKLCHNILDMSADIEKSNFLMGFRTANAQVASGTMQSLFVQAFYGLREPKIIHNKELFTKYIRILSDICYSRNVVGLYKAKAYFALLIIELIEAVIGKNQAITMSVQADQQKHDARINAILNYIHTYYMQNITLQSLSKYLHLSERQVRRSLRSDLNTNFASLLQIRRMNIAHELIVSTSLPLYEIASHVGYQSYNGFYTAFKTFFNTKPTNLRTGDTAPKSV